MSSDFQNQQLIEILTSVRDYQEALGSPDYETISTMLNDSFSAWLSAHRLGRVQLLSDDRLLFNVNGKLRDQVKNMVGINLNDRFLTITLSQFDDLRSTATALQKATTNYHFLGDGSYVWLVPDGFMAELTEQEKIWQSNGEGYFSHESICVSNTSDFDTICLLEILYEDLELESTSCEFEVKSCQSIHFRLDQLVDQKGDPMIRKNAPTSYKITSGKSKVVVQGSRILTSGEKSQFASFGTVMGWTPPTS